MRLALRDLSFLTGRSVVLAPNRLFVDVLSTQFTHDRLSEGRSTWERPAITTPYAWLTSLWQEKRYGGADLPALLSPGQEAALWQRLLEREHPDLFDFGGAASLAVSASRLVAEWQISLDHEAWTDSKDAEHFRTLYRMFRRECRELECIVRADLWRLASSWLAGSQAHVTLAAFDILSPALQSLPSQQEPLSPAPKRRKRIRAAQCENLPAEIEHCARWARRRIETCPAESVGVAVAGLAENHELVNRTFAQIFYPAGARDSISSAFHIHGQRALLSEPIVAAAERILELAASDLRVEDASAILLSPYLEGAQEERSARALADVQLRNRRDLRVTLGQIEYRTSQCPAFQEILRRVRHVLREQPRLASLSVWSEWTGNLLDAAGWPGKIKLTEREADAVEAWDDALNDLAALSYVLPPLPFDAARRELKRLLNRKGFGSAGDLFSPVQILDASAMPGLRFDAAALCGISDGAWPLLDPHQPFVPLRLQRQAGMPGTTAVAAAERKAKLTTQLLDAAPEMIATFSGEPSALLRSSLQVKATTASLWEGPRPVESYAIADLELLEDERGPALPRSLTPVGGVSIIKAQSLCPFQAFARYRLLADAPEEACFGLDARERGGFLHKALEHVWRAIGNSEKLKSLSEADLCGVINEGVEQAVREDGRSPFHELVSDTERRRLNDVILEWLRVEKTRKVPFTVELIEEKKTVSLAGLPLNLRVDRVDRLPDNSVLLIDYKSGQPSAKDLLTDRPKEPQLLVYAAAVDEHVDGVYIAQVRGREARAQGMAAREHFPEGRKSKNAPSWDAERDTVHGRLEKLAREFLEGHAAVDPQKDACTFCGVKLLCRVAEAGKAGEDDDAGE